jgi:hypothetical protein
LPTSGKRKTAVWQCLNKSTDFSLGTIQWHSAWRQYCFFPEWNTVFNRGCLEDINDFIQQLMDERKNKER